MSGGGSNKEEDIFEKHREFGRSRDVNDDVEQMIDKPWNDRDLNTIQLLGWTLGAPYAVACFCISTIL
jgi:hypothetical protein